MKDRRVAFRAFFLILLPFIIPSICFSKLAIELGPSYIVNLSNSNWKNTEGLNLGFKYQIAHKIYIVPKLSVYKFSSEPKVGYSLNDTYMGLSIAKNENAFYDFSIGIRIESSENIINPIFSIYSGVHHIKFANNSVSQFISPEVYKEQQKTVGFVGAGLGILISLSNRIKFVTESSFSVSFDYNYILVPIDFSVQINF